MNNTTQNNAPKPKHIILVRKNKTLTRAEFMLAQIKINSLI